MANNLKDHLKEVADAIRAKKGTSDLINPQDFSKEIASIEAGGSGGGESGGSNIEYLDVSGLDNNLKLQMISYSYYVKGVIEGEHLAIVGVPFFLFHNLGGVAGEVSYVAINFSDRVTIAINGSLAADNDITAAILANGEITQDELDSIPRITKEQFYDLNA